MRASLVILPGHTEIESTVRCFGVDVEDALSPAERTEVQRLAGFPTYRAGSRLNQQAPMLGSQPKLVRSRKLTIRSAEGFSTIMGAS